MFPKVCRDVCWKTDQVAEATPVTEVSPPISTHVVTACWTWSFPTAVTPTMKLRAAAEPCATAIASPEPRS